MKLGVIILPLLAVCLCPLLAAKEVVVGALPSSPYLDTEVSTNVAFGFVRTDVKVFDVRMDLAGTVSNSVQIAFGCDVDGDGDLAPGETGLVLGWRAGRYFLEDVAAGSRLFETNCGPAGVARFLHLRVEMDSAALPRRLSLSNEVGACFSDLTALPPPHSPFSIFRSSFVLKVTRRGVDAADELCSIRNDYRSLHVILR